MGKARILIIAVLCVGFLLSFSIFYTVRFTDTAVVTLQWADRRMNRRTLVLQRQQGQWLIVHIHASVVTEQ